MAGVILFILGTLGLALIARGVVGRRVGNKPYCRGCRYDLSGILNTAESCPECGSLLSPKSAVVRGIRKRRLPSLALGLMLVLAASGTIGASIWAKANNFDFNTIKPTWMLLGEMERGDEWQDTGATYEVAQRLMAGSLNDATISRYAQVVLKKAPRDTSPIALAAQSTFWSHHMVGLLVDPATPDTVRAPLASFALEQLSRAPNGITALEQSQGTHAFLAPMDHLLTIGKLTDDQARAFLNLRTRPEINLLNETGPGARPVFAQLVVHWSSNRVYNAMLSGSPILSRMDWSPTLFKEPIVLIECSVINREDQMDPATSRKWFVTADGSLESPPAPAEPRHARRPAQQLDWPTPSAFVIGDFTAIQAPAAPGRHTVTFDVRITLLKKAPGNQSVLLEPDSSNITVVHRIEVPFIVTPDDDTPEPEDNR